METGLKLEKDLEGNKIRCGGQSKLRLAEEDTGKGGREEFFGAEQRKRKGKRSKSWGGGLSSRRYSLSFFLSLVHFTLFFLCYQLLGDGGAMLAASATRANGAEELISEKLQQAARWPAACWPAGAALAGGAAGDWRRQASCSAALHGCHW
ncbi:hypothetical protein CK203_109999 [Vitis vinifera]|uniref:Uncharacterized protein n=1 Tax=Vitis vinifera TaxID=29760 RepID=A0A438CT08_VITVI|nr:hypothetical protein CK203_109999 [Vitis vinifera]